MERRKSSDSANKKKEQWGRSKNSNGDGTKMFQKIAIMHQVVGFFEKRGAFLLRSRCS